MPQGGVQWKRAVALHTGGDRAKLASRQWPQQQQWERLGAEEKETARGDERRREGVYVTDDEWRKLWREKVWWGKNGKKMKSEEKCTRMMSMVVEIIKEVCKRWIHFKSVQGVSVCYRKDVWMKMCKGRCGGGRRRKLWLVEDKCKRVETQSSPD